MNALTTTAAPSPALAALAQAVADKLANPHPNCGATIPVITPDLRAEAATAWAALNDALRPTITRPAVAQLLATIATAVRNPPSRDDLAARISAFHAAVADLPALALNPGTLAQALAEFAFFPAAADIVRILRAETDRLRSHARALLAIAAAPEPEPDPVLTEADRARIRAGLERFQQNAKLSLLQADDGPGGYRKLSETAEAAGDPSSASETARLRNEEAA